MINKEGKLFGKISIIDILVVIVIIAMAFGVYMRFFKTPEKIEVKTEKFTYVVRIDNVRDVSIEALKNSGDIYDINTAEHLGKIVKVEPQPYSVTSIKSDGTTVLFDYPERYSAIVTIETDGNVSQNGYYTATNRLIGVGSAMHFESKYIESMGDVISISK